MPEQSEHGVLFDSSVRKIGGSSYYALLKQEIVDYLDLRHGSNLCIQTEHSEHGRYISIWNPNQQENNQNPE